MRALLLSLLAAVFLVVAGNATAANIPGQYIVVLKDGVDVPSVVADHVRSAHADVLQVYEHALSGYAAQLSQSGLAAVRADDRVLFVSQDGEATADAQTLPTGIDRIEADKSSTVSGDGSGSVNVNVAVLDTGIDLHHPDLNVVGGKSCLKTKSFD